ncbi:MAG: rRNA ((1402)-2-O)-methyltransferase [Pseudomonadota bacterium]
MDTPHLEPGLYIVATPIGNLGDLTRRAVEILSGADLIACEDTRVTGKLLNHIGIKKPMRRYDDHASDEARDRLLAEMGQKAVVLVSDAGTPLISDPGYKLVRMAREQGIAITSLPGPSALIVALTPNWRPCRGRWCSMKPGRGWWIHSMRWRGSCRAAKWPWRAN